MIVMATNTNHPMALVNSFSHWKVPGLLLPVVVVERTRALMASKVIRERCVNNSGLAIFA